MQIIECIIDLDIDYSLKLFSTTFKHFVIPPRKIELEIGNFMEVSQECDFAHDFLMRVEDDKQQAALPEKQERLRKKKLREEKKLERKKLE